MIQKLRTSSLYFISILFVLFAPVSFVEAAGSLTIQELSLASGTVSVNSPLTFKVVPTGFSSPYFTISDNRGIYLTSNLSSFGEFSWTPMSRDVGNHTITITASDSAGNSASASKVITVIQPSVTLTAMKNGPAAFAGSPMEFQITPVGFTNPTYWIGDSVGGSTLTNSKLNSLGAFYWVPTIFELGQHNVTINVSDQSGHFVELSQVFTVSDAIKPAVQSLVPGTTTPVGGAVTFSLTSPGFTAPRFAITDSFIPSTISADKLSETGVFSWIPVQSQIGVHNLRMTITDSSGQSSIVLQTIVVQAPSITVEAMTPGKVVMVGDTLKFNLQMSGLIVPTFAVSDNHPGGSSVRTNNISSSGLFIWTPVRDDIGVHNIAINAVDTNGNYATVRTDITVVGIPIAPPSPVVASSVYSPPVSAIGTPSSGNSTGGYYFTKSLAIGSESSEVLELQKRLASLGFFFLTPTSYYGSITSSAVKKFQSSRGLEPVGFVGPGTRAALNASGASVGASVATAVITSVSPLVATANGNRYVFTKSLAIGSENSEVLELQKRLASLGFFFVTPTSYYGPVTAAAVKKFQASVGLEQVGFVGSGTRAALNAR